MADQPDFTVKTKPIDPGAIAEIIQRRTQIENQQNQQVRDNFDQRNQRIMQAVQAGQEYINEISHGGTPKLRRMGKPFTNSQDIYASAHWAATSLKSSWIVRKASTTCGSK